MGCLCVVYLCSVVVIVIGCVEYMDGMLIVGVLVGV